MHRSNRGFTLIEIMIVIAIIGIVITIGYPSLTEYIKKARRTEIASLLSEQAQILERHYSKNNVYSNATGLSTGNDFYTIIPTTLTDQTFTLTAARRSGSSMAADKCGDFTINNTGKRDIANAAAGVTVKDCWGR
ncbi:prepilin-type N-terminal cleavage/methylation domain-containing protein [Pseudomonas sp. D2-30]|uniref:type IV pilin protein n=1 Tax=unclassified Pseudomonas TaxID=196821 RepID=UPI003B672BB5